MVFAGFFISGARYVASSAVELDYIDTSTYSTDDEKRAATTFDISNLNTLLDLDWTLEFELRNLGGSQFRFGFGLSPYTTGRNPQNTEAYFYFLNWGASNASMTGDFNSQTDTINNINMSGFDTSDWIAVKLEFVDAATDQFKLYLDGNVVGSFNTTWQAHDGLTNAAFGYRPLESFDSWLSDFELRNQKFNGNLLTPPQLTGIHPPTDGTMTINSQSLTAANFTISGATTGMNGTYIVDGSSGLGNVGNAHISLYDNDTNTRLVAAKANVGNTLTLNIELPHASVITKYLIATRPDESSATYYPNNLTLSGSNDEVNYTQLSSGTPTLDAINSFTNSTAYKYYKIQATSSHADYIVIADFNLQTN